MISLTCDECDKSLRLRDELAGKRIKCPGCGAVIAVPMDDEEAEDIAPPPRPKAPAPKAAPIRGGKPTKTSRSRDEDDEDNDEEIDDRRGRKSKSAGDVTKPSSVLLLLGLVLGLGGLVGMCFFIFLAKTANDEVNEKIGDKEHLLKPERADFEMATKAGANLIAAKHKEKIDALERDIENIPRGGVKMNAIIAAGLGIVFLAGVILRGYHFVQMKKWHAAHHGIGKKKKRRDDDDDD